MEDNNLPNEKETIQFINDIINPLLNKKINKVEKRDMTYNFISSNSTGQEVIFQYTTTPSKEIAVKFIEANNQLDYTIKKLNLSTDTSKPISNGIHRRIIEYINPKSNLL